MDDDLLILGLADQIRQDRNAPFGVWSENWTIVRAFLDLSGGWGDGLSADGKLIRQIARDKIKNTLELMGVKRREWANVFDGLKIMEAEVIDMLYGEAK